MNYIVFVYKGNSRELRKIILAILKSGMANNIKRINYVQNYILQTDGIKKIEEKLLLINTDNQDGLLDFLSKNFPQIERIYVN